MNAKLATLIVKVLDFIAEHPELETDFDIWRVGPERELRASFCYNYKVGLDALGMPVAKCRYIENGRLIKSMDFLASEGNFKLLVEGLEKLEAKLNDH